MTHLLTPSLLCYFVTLWWPASPHRVTRIIWMSLRHTTGLHLLIYIKIAALITSPKYKEKDGRVKARLHIRFLHAFYAFHCTFLLSPCFYSISVSNEKSQCNAENACGNRMCKLGFTEIKNSRGFFPIFFLNSRS